MFFFGYISPVFLSFLLSSSSLSSYPSSSLPSARQRDRYAAAQDIIIALNIPLRLPYLNTHNSSQSSTIHPPWAGSVKAAKPETALPTSSARSAGTRQTRNGTRTSTVRIASLMACKRPTSEAHASTVVKRLSTGSGKFIRWLPLNKNGENGRFVGSDSSEY